MSTLWAAIAAAQLATLAGGQLAQPAEPPTPARAGSRLADDDEAPAGAKPSAEPAVPSPMPPLLPPLPLPAELPARPAAPARPDRFVTTDGRVHVGHVLREIEGGFEFQDEKGTRYPIALSAVKESERGEEAWQVPAATVPAMDAEAAQKALTLAFDVYRLEQERSRLTYGEKALVAGLGAVACAIGFAALDGDVGKAVGIVGAVGAAGGGIALGVTALRSHSLSRRAEEGREQLKALGQPAGVRAAKAVLPAMALRF